MAEPLNKRVKKEKAAGTIQAILPNDYTNEIDMVLVYVTAVKDKKEISKIIKELAALLPLPQLQHLKRVKDNQIIVCETKETSNCKDDLAAFLEMKCLNHEIINQIVSAIDLKQVPAVAPRLRWQYDQVTGVWPCKFHPDKYMEQRFNSSNFTLQENEFHFLIGDLLKDLSRKVVENAPVGICVDPRMNSIVAIAAASIRQSPVMHCTMVLVDNVATSQDSGAWNENLNKLQSSFESEKESELQTSGIPRPFKDYIENNFNYNHIKMGAERIKTKEKLKSQEMLSLDGDNLAKYGPYLCTGYDIFLLKEPCLMCAMALVHSRAKRVFFLEKSAKGCLSTRYKLQGVPELNHHYEVYQILYGQGHNTIKDNKS